MKHLVFLFLGIMNFATAQTCLPNGIVLTRQSQVDSFSIRYPDCTEILGGVRIENSTVSNLSGLRNITRIEGDLIAAENSLLESLDGLHNLTKIGGSVTISRCPLLSDLQGLEALNYIGKDLRIREIHSLEDLTGLEGILHIRGSLDIGNNSDLVSVEGLNNLETVEKHLNVNANISLVSLEGLRGLRVACNRDSLVPNSFCNSSVSNNIALESLGFTSLERAGSIALKGNTALRSFRGLENLEVVEGTLTLETSSYVTSMEGLEGLKTVKGELIILGIGLLNDSISGLTTFEGLNNLEVVEGDLRLGAHQFVEDLHGLESLRKVRFLDISSFHNLKSLHGLESLDSMSYLAISKNRVLKDLRGLPAAFVGNTGFPDVQITGNGELRSLDGLEDLEIAANTWLFIKDNPKLSSCAVQNVCNHIAANRRTVISGNLPGCNSSEEILQICALSIAEPSLAKELQLHPNPTSSIVEISGQARSQIVDIDVYNQLGQMVGNENETFKSIDLSLACPGLYYLTVLFQDGSSQSYKVVKR